jgi:hypothetical protein
MGDFVKGSYWREGSTLDHHGMRDREQARECPAMTVRQRRRELHGRQAWVESRGYGDSCLLGVMQEVGAI